MSTTIIDGVDYGPLAALIGSWQGNKGTDIAPEPDGKENNSYYETLCFEAIGDVSNAEQQTLAALRYQQVVYRQSNQKAFHNQTGYWMWDAENKILMQSLTIPRGVCVLAGGSAETNQTSLRVEAYRDDKDWQVIESPFMRDKASTLSYIHQLTVADESLNYQQTTVVDIYGKHFDHTDQNSLTRTN
jgi:hypothetical protein